jgi:hypothetical protein
MQKLLDKKIRFFLVQEARVICVCHGAAIFSLNLWRNTHWVGVTLGCRDSGLFPLSQEHSFGTPICFQWPAITRTINQMRSRKQEGPGIDQDDTRGVPAASKIFEASSLCSACSFWTAPGSCRIWACAQATGCHFSYSWWCHNSAYGYASPQQLSRKPAVTELEHDAS